jgi:hypothetical protein
MALGRQVQRGGHVSRDQPTENSRSSRPLDTAERRMVNLS